MSREDMYECWAPARSVWSRWAKPVLFAEMPLLHQATELDARIPASALDGCPPPSERAAIVVELPGVESVETGLALARRGYWPVPLFNAASGPSAIVDVRPIQMLLARYAEAIAALSIPSDAPPAFLLDSNRLGGGHFVTPGRFDNRWIVFPQDFPSGGFLLSQQVRKAVLMKRGAQTPADDLAHVLARWQDVGVSIFCVDPSESAPAALIRVAAPRHFGALWYRVLAALGLRRNSAGGFGAVVPTPSSSGSGFG